MNELQRKIMKNEASYPYNNKRIPVTFSVTKGMKCIAWSFHSELTVAPGSKPVAPPRQSPKAWTKCLRG